MNCLDLLSLSPRELLTTTRAVRKRLDLTRPVERKVIEECVAIAQQAPNASNRQNWHFVIVDDFNKKARLAELFRKGWDLYVNRPSAIYNREVFFTCIIIYLYQQSVTSPHLPSLF